jgi:hypothetical protein
MLNAGHIEVDIPAFFFDIVHDFGDMRANAGQRTHIAHRLQRVAHGVDPARPPGDVGRAAVVIDGDRALGGYFPDVAAHIGVFGGSLRDPLNSASFLTVFMEDAQDMAVAARLPGVDAGAFTGGEELLDVGGREVIPHLGIGGRRDMGISRNGIAPNDQAGNGEGTPSCGWEGDGRNGWSCRGSG